MSTIDRDWEQMCENLQTVVNRQAQIIQSISEKILLITPGGGGGGGNATFVDYKSGENYHRNNVVVDTETETCYRVLIDYISDTVEHDCQFSYVMIHTEPTNWDPTQYYYYDELNDQYVAGSEGDPWQDDFWYKYTPKLKLLAGEGQVIGMSHSPTSEEIQNMPDDAIVAVYSTTDPPYITD